MVFQICVVMKVHPKNQSGMVLMVFLFAIALALTLLVLKNLHSVDITSNQHSKTMQSLQKAKENLLAWSVSHSLHPGQMPFPDRNGDSNYDGKSDCNSPTSTFDYSFLLGQLPVIGQTNPCSLPQVGLGQEYKDAEGNRLWYAVSRNLTHIYENNTVTSIRDPVINPDIVNYPVTNPDSNNYPSIVSAPLFHYPWLKVFDANGHLLSDRVAVVIIAPGAANGGQNRAGNAPNPNQYLDSLTLGGVTYNNANYAQADQSFIAGLDSRQVSVADPRFSHPYVFNDKLIYITIDELVDAISKRVANEVNLTLKKYKLKTGAYPYAALLDKRQTNHNAFVGSNKGLVPIDETDGCSCIGTNQCTCNFGAIEKVTLTRASGTWTARTGACTRYSANCNCIGAGSCTNGSEYFVCNAFGVCNHNLTGSNNYTYTVPTYANIKLTSGSGCLAPSGKTINCNNAGAFSIGLDMPNWITENLWQDFLYYEWSSSNTLKVGADKYVDAILINVGATLTSEMGVVQSRPSLNVADYLDSAENTNGDTQFDAYNKKKTTQFNDHPFIITP
jgi:hypothetical protein